MTITNSDIQQIDTLAGVHSLLDTTSISTPNYVFADKIRFINGKPEKIGGWISRTFDFSNTIVGKARSLFTSIKSGKLETLIGTHKRLYAVAGTRLTNITPLSASSVAVANALATNYDTLANNPITTVDGSTTITIADSSASRFEVGDTITLSGAATTNGIDSADLAGDFKIKSIGTNSYTVRVATAATSSGAGGGASVVRASGLINVTKNTHGMAEGDRVKISGAATTGGIVDTAINLEFIIRNIDTNTFDVMTAGTATSAVTSGGGASTVYYPQIAGGYENSIYGQGFGAGLFGVGLFGVSVQSSTGTLEPRTWFFDRYGTLTVMTPGNQGSIYKYSSSTITAPEIVTDAPTAVNYMFISDDIMITLGAGGVENKIKSSNQFNIEDWTLSTTSAAYENTLSNADKLISHVSIPGNNLIFSENACWSFRFVGIPICWELKLKDPNIGIIAPMARISVGGIGYFMGKSNFYMWKGGNIEVIPSNNQYTKECTILRYVFDNLNASQKSKIFCWYNPKFDEIWWHYPSAGSNEPDRVARLNRKDYSWTMDTMDRTCAEYPNINSGTPKLVSSAGTFYSHESGTDADGVAMPFTFTTNDRTLGKKMTMLTGVIPDSNQTGSVSVEIKTRAYPQSSTLIYDKTFTVSPTNDVISENINGRIWNYTISGNALGQSFRMGNWIEQGKLAGDR